MATDLDGTLLDASGRVSPRTRTVLDQLDRRGVPVVFVTGRPMRWMEDLWEAVGGHGVAVCSNGAIVYDVSARAVRRALTIPVGTAVEVAARLRDRAPGSRFAVESVDGFAREAEFGGRHTEPPGTRVGQLEDIAGDTMVKLLAAHDDYTPDAYLEVADAAVGDLVSVTHSSTFTLVEMSALGVTKATTLARVCTELGVAAADVIAFGDMPNDLAMLRWAGTSYAMADAHPAARAAATHTAPGHDADGVAEVLAGLFGLPAANP